jgi:hypothetical protein
MAVTLQRVFSDEELHKRLRAAFGSGRQVYTRVGSDRDVGRIVARLRSDKNAQEALRTFIDDLVAASGRLTEKRRKHHRRRNMILLSSAVSAGSALAAASGRLTEKPKKHHRVRNLILVSGFVAAGAGVVVRRRRTRGDGFAVTDGGYTPADSPTQAPAEAEATS